MIERVILVRRDSGRDVDGIRDYCERLAEELERLSVAVEQRAQTAGAPDGGVLASLRLWRDVRRSGGSSAVVLQYMPFCFARWGFAPWLLLSVLATRVRRRRPAIAVMVHEPYVSMGSWRWALMGLWQRLQLWTLRLSADVVFTSIEAWSERLARQLPRRPVRHLPVGSNFPDARAERADERGRLGVGDETVVVATLGRDHPAWLGDYVVAAVNAIAAAARPPTLLSMGAEAPSLAGLDPAIEVHACGYLEARDVARRLAAADIFLAPLLDGVSTRRTTVMAALQHGLPVVGTRGPLTDSVLRESGPALTLTEVGEVESFAAAAARLADDAGARAVGGGASRRLYERCFDWPVIGRKLLAELPEV